MIYKKPIKLLLHLGLITIAGATSNLQAEEVRHTSIQKMTGGNSSWTLEEMQNARPATPSLDDIQPHSATPAAIAESPGPRGVVTGVPPLPEYGGPEGVSRVQKEIIFDDEAEAVVTNIEPMGYAYPPPFSRWQVFRKYRRYPISTVGKLFYKKQDDPSSSWVCSGVVIGENEIQTTGHCLHDGPGGDWHKDYMFCPAYDNGPNSVYGCWSSWTETSTTTAWTSNGNFDYDWGGIRFNPWGDTISAPIGNVTGIIGRAWNYEDVHYMNFGYPQAAPFTGGKMVACAASRAYTRNTDGGTDGQDSNYIGCDMSPGVSGGPWMLNYNKANGNPSYECGSLDGGDCGVYINGHSGHSLGGQPNAIGGPQYRSSATAYDIKEWWDNFLP